MGAVSVQQMSDRVAELMEERLGLRGRTLADKLTKGGRALPRKVRDAAVYLAAANEQALLPRYAARLDNERIAEAYDACVRYLKPLGAGQRRRTALMEFLTNVAVAIFVTAALVITVLVLRGFV